MKMLKYLKIVEIYVMTLIVRFSSNYRKSWYESKMSSV